MRTQTMSVLMLCAACGTDPTLRPTRGNAPEQIESTTREAEASNPLLPLMPNAYWAFDGDARVDVRARLDASYELHGLEPQPIVVRNRVDGSVDTIVGRQATTWLDPAATAGEHWAAQVQPGACGWRVVTVEKSNTQLTTEAGTYHNLMQYSFSADPDPAVRCAKPALRRMWVAQGLGIVAVQHADQAQVHLRSARTRAGTYPPPLVEVNDLLTQPKAYVGREVQIVGATAMQEASCTEKLCRDSEPCCNWCSARVDVGGLALRDSATHFVSCAGNECAYETQCKALGSDLGTAHTLYGRFELDDTPVLVLHQTN